MLAYGRNGVQTRSVSGDERELGIIVETTAKTQEAVIKLIDNEFPVALAAASYRIVEADAENPVVLLRTIERDPQALLQRHNEEIARVTDVVTQREGSLFSLDAADAADAYEWTLYHLLQNEKVIKELMFPITYYQPNGSDWLEIGRERPRYFDIGITNYQGNVDDRTLSLIADVSPTGMLHGESRLLDLAVVIRSKDAGINQLTFDVIFTSPANYETALRSNVFHKENVARTLGLPTEWWWEHSSSIVAMRSRSRSTGPTFLCPLPSGMSSARNSSRQSSG